MDTDEDWQHCLQQPRECFVVKNFVDFSILKNHPTSGQYFLHIPSHSNHRNLLIRINQLGQLLKILSLNRWVDLMVGHLDCNNCCIHRTSLRICRTCRYIQSPSDENLFHSVIM